MKRIYKTISQDEINEMLVNTLKSTETDLFIHESTKERILKMLPFVEGTFKEQMEGKIAELDVRIKEVETILNALYSQINDNIIDETLERIKLNNNK